MIILFIPLVPPERSMNEDVLADNSASCFPDAINALPRGDKISGCVPTAVVIQDVGLSDPQWLDA